MTEELNVLVKTLSRNDLGMTGSHQAGILVPRIEAAISFFPALDESEFNPRRHIVFFDPILGRDWKLNFIHYNGKLIGRSSRNEYRLTGLTRFFKSHNAGVGDELEFQASTNGDMTVRLRAVTEHRMTAELNPNVIVLTGKWRTIRRGNFL